MSKCGIRSQFEGQNMSLMSKCDIRSELNDKIGFRLIKCDICHKFESQNRVLNVKMRYSARIRILKLEFECQNKIFG